jgi:DNA (cytosine-5)-methyltransferase 1
LADAESSGRTEECSNARGSATGDYPEGLPSGFEHGSGAVRGYWRPADWVLCRDPDGPTWRPVEPGTFPLAHGAPARVGRLRAYGNAINAEAASAFIGSVM